MEISITSREFPPSPPMKRASGIHVSSIISDLCIRRGIFDPHRVPNPTLLAVGSAFERAIILNLQDEAPGRYIQVGELCLDDIYGNPDLYDNAEDTIDEIKFTYQSSNNSPDSPKFWRYLTQLKTYCHMVSTCRGRLRVCYARGNYSAGAPEPECLTYTCLFTRSELISNWSLIKSHSVNVTPEQHDN